MASDQMLPNSTISSKKQQQLEAGKKRLEEFRKKKAAAKKAVSNNSTNSANGDLHETKPLVSDAVHVTVTDTTSISSFNIPDVVDLEKSKGFHHPEENIHSNSSNFSNIDALKNSKDDGVVKDSYTSAKPVTTSKVLVTNSSPEGSLNDQPANGPPYRDPSSEAKKSIQDMLEKNRYSSISSVDDDRNPKNLLDNPSNESSSSLWTPEVIPSYNQTSMSASLAGRRSRPSFLDSITTSRNSSNSLSSLETDKSNPFSSKIYPVDAPASSNTQSFMNLNPSVANVGDPFRNGSNDFDMERRNAFNSTKQNEDFAALEQHIEDLTQEKFSLQRALEASRVLAESLASENSALTDTYNQQGGVVNQLKSDMERLQEEIKAQLVELEAMRTEYGNAQLECSAADERAKLLASEVIGLEEKALRLRSNELKLERQLENLQAEMSSQKRKINSLEKDRQDLQSTIEALQEEKKLMQSKLRKAPATTNSVDIKKIPTTKKEASTSTDDLVDENEDGSTNLATQATVGESEASGTFSQSLSTNFGLEVSSSSIPPDQTRMIQNINTLISELALEKEELMQALTTESSLSSKLKDLNKELSQKLEVQTQRLELLTSQSMVSDNSSSVRKPAPRTVVDNTPYADEGDEVVERVLGWIMKLFPGGPSRRQTKHL